MPPDAQLAEAPIAPPDPVKPPGAAGRALGPHSVQAAADKILAGMSAEPEKGPTDNAGEPEPASRKAEVEPSPEPAQQPSQPETEESELLRELDAAEGEPGEGDKAEGDDKPEARKTPTNMDDLAALTGFSADDIMDALTLTIKADGEEEAVGLRDLVSSHQREADYRLKSAENAEKGNLLAQAAAATQAERQHYAQQIVPLIQQLGQIIQADETAMAALKDEDPYEYNRRRDAMEESRKVLQGAQAEQQRMADLDAQQNRAVYLKDVEQHAEVLIEKVPEWGKSPETAKKDIAEIKDFMVTEYGVPREMIEQEYRSPVILAARDAMRYRKLTQNRDKRLKEARLKPKYTKAGVATRPETVNAQRMKKAQARLKKSGSVRDFAAVLATQMQ